MHSFCMLCARIVVHGKSFLKAIIPFSAKVFNVSKEFKLTKSKVCASVLFLFFFCLFKSCNNIYDNEKSTEESQGISLAQSFKGLAAGSQSFQSYCI